MGCGQKACAERDEEEFVKSQAVKFNSTSINQQIHHISESLKHLNRLDDGSLSLTRGQWYLLNESIKHLKVLV